jgi:ABC-type uncharacterized transport system auxiliary subunit
VIDVNLSKSFIKIYKEAEWGQRSVRFYDLDGHIIEVGENMSPPE